MTMHILDTKGLRGLSGAEASVAALDSLVLAGISCTAIPPPTGGVGKCSEQIELNAARISLAPKNMLPRCHLHLHPDTETCH